MARKRVIKKKEAMKAAIEKAQLTEEKKAAEKAQLTEEKKTQSAEEKVAEKVSDTAKEIKATAKTAARTAAEKSQIQRAGAVKHCFNNKRKPLYNSFSALFWQEVAL